MAYVITIKQNMLEMVKTHAPFSDGFTTLVLADLERFSPARGLVNQ